MEAVNQIGRQKNDYGIDDQKEESQGQYGNGQGKDDQNGFYQEVEQAEHYGYDYSGKHGIDTDPRQYIAEQYNGKGVQQ
tara:strand:+ start:148 stop:384 length:237 start_codon:yes stop_codon:yes gene_type:complete